RAPYRSQAGAASDGGSNGRPGHRRELRHSGKTILSQIMARDAIPAEMADPDADPPLRIRLNPIRRAPLLRKSELDAMAATRRVPIEKQTVLKVEPTAYCSSRPWHSRYGAFQAPAFEQSRWGSEHATGALSGAEGDATESLPIACFAGKLGRSCDDQPLY